MIRVRCTNRQPQLDGTVCTWAGRRKGRRMQLPGGRVVQLKPTYERCPRCGSKVEEVPA